MDDKEIYNTLMNIKKSRRNDVWPKVENLIRKHKLKMDEPKELEKLGYVEKLKYDKSGYERIRLTERGEFFILAYEKMISEEK